MIELSTPESLSWLVRHMRAADRREIFGLRDNDNENELVADVLRASSWTVFADGRPVGMAGFRGNPTLPWVTEVFGFGTDEWLKGWRTLTRFIVRDMIPGLMRSGTMRTYSINAEWRPASHRWLESMGARRLADTLITGRDGSNYVVFEWRSEEL